MAQRVHMIITETKRHEIDVTLTDAEVQGVENSATPADVVSHYATPHTVVDTEFKMEKFQRK